MARKILLVDDERDLVLATKLYLEGSGNFEVIGAYDGQEALQYVARAETRPDVIILDVTMPRLSGWDVLRVLKSDPGTADIPVIMLTAAAQDSDKSRGWMLQVDFYQTKPFDPQDLALVIERVLKGADDDAIALGPDPLDLPH